LAGDAVRDLLLATKGFAGNFVWDPREPYRKELEHEMEAIAARCNDKLSEAFRDLIDHGSYVDSDEGAAVRWLTHDMQSGLVPDLTPDVDPWLQKLHDSDRKVDDWMLLRMDSTLRSESTPPIFPIPRWVYTPNTLETLKSLELVDMVGAFHTGDAAYDLLHLGAEASLVSGEMMEPLTTIWYTAWLRGFCQLHIHQVNSLLQGLMMKLFGVQSYCRAEAKGFERMWEKTKEVIQVMESLGLDTDQETRDFRCTAANVVTDVFGCTCVLNTVKDMKKGYQQLEKLSWRNDGAQLLRVQNKFHSEARGPYRDMKVWIAVLVPVAHPAFGCSEVLLPVETQLHLNVFHAQKHVMHLPYEYTRGSMDWLSPKEKQHKEKPEEKAAEEAGEAVEESKARDPTKEDFLRFESQVKELVTKLSVPTSIQREELCKELSKVISLTQQAIERKKQFPSSGEKQTNIESGEVDEVFIGTIEPVLAEILRTEVSYSLREAAIQIVETCGKLGDKDYYSLPQMEKILRTSQDAGKRKKALETIIQMTSSRSISIETFAKAAQEDPETSVREAAIQLLADLYQENANVIQIESASEFAGRPTAREKRVCQLAFDAVITVLRDDGPKGSATRKVAMEAISKMDEQHESAAAALISVAEILNQILQKDVDSKLRDFAVTCFARIHKNKKTNGLPDDSNRLWLDALGSILENTSEPEGLRLHSGKLMVELVASSSAILMPEECTKLQSSLQTLKESELEEPSICKVTDKVLMELEKVKGTR
jgi:hypothetical protein